MKTEIHASSTSEYYILYFDKCGLSLPGAIYVVAGSSVDYDYFNKSRIRPFDYDRKFDNWKLLVSTICIMIANTYNSDAVDYSQTLFPISMAGMSIFEINDHTYMSIKQIITSLNVAAITDMPYGIETIKENVSKHIPQTKYV